jgi:hypothetical protein
MPLAIFEPEISGSERSQTHSFDSVATEIGHINLMIKEFCSKYAVMPSEEIFYAVGDYSFQIHTMPFVW